MPRGQAPQYESITRKDTSDSSGPSGTAGTCRRIGSLHINYTGVGGVTNLVDQRHTFAPFDCEFFVHEGRKNDSAGHSSVLFSLAPKPFQVSNTYVTLREQNETNKSFHLSGPFNLGLTMYPFLTHELNSEKKY